MLITTNYLLQVVTKNGFENFKTHEKLIKDICRTES